LKDLGIVISESALSIAFFLSTDFFVVDLSVLVDWRFALSHQTGFAGVISSPSAGYDFV